MQTIIWSTGTCSVCQDPDISVGPISIETGKQMCQKCADKEKDLRRGRRRKRADRIPSIPKQTVPVTVNRVYGGVFPVIPDNPAPAQPQPSPSHKKPGDCKPHHWVLDSQSKGTCKLCGEEKQFAKTYSDCLLPEHKRPQKLSSMIFRRT